MVLADGYHRNRETDKALRAATRLVEVLNTKAKPEGLDDADWKTKKDTMRGRGYWITGVLQGDRNQYAAADTALRAALPLIKDNAMRAPALFYLGLANYQLGKIVQNRAQMADGAKFSEECATLPGPYQALAQKNASSIRAELAPPKKKR